MKINNIRIEKKIGDKGLVGFCSFVLEDCLYLGNIAIYKKMNEDRLRLVFPEKKINDTKISIFYPINKMFYFEIEEIINKEYYNA